MHSFRRGSVHYISSLFSFDRRRVCVFQFHSKLQSKQINSEKHVKNSLKWVLRDNPFITQEAIGFDCWWNMFLKLSFFTYRLCADLFKLSSLSSVWARIKLPYHKKGKKEYDSGLTQVIFIFKELTSMHSSECWNLKGIKFFDAFPTCTNINRNKLRLW